LEEVGTAVDPAELVRRIPVGLEIEGLKQGIMRLVKEYEIQYSISEGVAKVLEGEVAMGMDTLRAGQKKAVRFEVVHESSTDVDLTVHDVPTKVEGDALPMPKRKVPKHSAEVKPGHCVGCGEAFHEEGIPEIIPPLSFDYSLTNVIEQKRCLSLDSLAATFIIFLAFYAPTRTLLTMPRSIAS
jgi:hypothetical protein